MKKLIFIAAILVVAATATRADEASAVNICKGQDQRCTETCDLDKVLWFYKGDAHENCMQRCDEQINACLAEDLDVDKFEVILPRSADGERQARDLPSIEGREVDTP